MHDLDRDSFEAMVIAEMHGNGFDLSAGFKAVRGNVASLGDPSNDPMAIFAQRAL